MAPPVPSSLRWPSATADTTSPRVPTADPVSQKIARSYRSNHERVDLDATVAPPVPSSLRWPSATADATSPRVPTADPVSQKIARSYRSNHELLSGNPLAASVPTRPSLRSYDWSSSGKFVWSVLPDSVGKRRRRNMPRMFASPVPKQTGQTRFPFPSH
jgi:hypothetical protein